MDVPRPPSHDVSAESMPVGHRPAQAPSDRWGQLIVAGLGTLVLYVVLFLRPFPLTHFDPAQPRTAEPLIDYLGAHLPSTWLGHGLGLALVFALYGVGWHASRAATSRRMIVTAAAFAVLYCTLFVFVRPEMTVDIIDYAFRSRMILDYGISPLTNAPDDLPESAAWLKLLHWREIPTPYGPLWLAIGLGTYRLAGDSLLANLYALKALSAMAVLGCLSLFGVALRRTAPGWIATAIVLFGWNPLVLIELICNGHNDGVMVFFIVTALAAALHERWLLVLPALAAAVLIKATAALFIPFVLIAGLRHVLTRPHRRVIGGVIGGGLIGLALVISLYGLFWAGPDTLRHLSRAQLGTVINSPVAALLVLSKYIALPVETRVVAILVVANAAFVATYLICLVRLGKGRASLVTACFDGVAAFLFIGATWFWPWYVVWLLAPAALLRDGRRQVLAMALSATALAYYLVKPLGLTSVGYSWALLVLFILPVTAVIMVDLWQRWSTRRLERWTIGGWSRRIESQQWAP
ncbi:MAG: hypothetical protein IT340_15275 [Chloroflexi bacterium]|nr:hypothetical protein [Chloroflexota bacterium]